MLCAATSATTAESDASTPPAKRGRGGRARGGGARAAPRTSAAAASGLASVRMVAHMISEHGHAVGSEIEVHLCLHERTHMHSQIYRQLYTAKVAPQLKVDVGLFDSVIRLHKMNSVRCLMCTARVGGHLETHGSQNCAPFYSFYSFPTYLRIQLWRI